MTEIDWASVRRLPVSPYSWRSQMMQYPRKMREGLQYIQGSSRHGLVDCLLYYGPDKRLHGILNHYGFDVRGYEKAGNINLWVDPAWQRRGIGSLLLAEADKRWGPLNFAQQKYSDSGAALAQKYLQHKEGDA